MRCELMKIAKTLALWTRTADRAVGREEARQHSADSERHDEARQRAKNFQRLLLICVGVAVAAFGAASRTPVVAETQARQNMMSAAESERNKATMRRLIDAGNTNDPAIISKAIDELVEPDAVVRNPSPLGVPGAQGLKLLFTMLLRAYPDLHITIEDLIAEGNKVVVRDTVTGTHRGEYMGIAATGKSVTYNEIFIARFVNGRLAEVWGVVDVLAQMRQLGVIPALQRPH